MTNYEEEYPQWNDWHWQMRNRVFNAQQLSKWIANLHHWDLSRSYRVPGKVYPEQKVAIFKLSEAEVIDAPLP